MCWTLSIYESAKTIKLSLSVWTCKSFNIVEVVFLPYMWIYYHYLYFRRWIPFEIFFGEKEKRFRFQDIVWNTPLCLEIFKDWYIRFWVYIKYFIEWIFVYILHSTQNLDFIVDKWTKSMQRFIIWIYCRSVR